MTLTGTLSFRPSRSKDQTGEPERREAHGKEANMHRSIRNHFLVALVVFAAPFLIYASDQANFSGIWKLDTARSPGVNRAAITLNIKDGNQTLIRFTCSPGGGNCYLDENGRKAKVSLWYDGSALMILKTGGRKQDATTERRLELSPDGNTLKVQFTNMDLDNSSKPEVLVFTKQPALAAATTK